MGCIFVLDGQGVRAGKGHVEGTPYTPHVGFYSFIENLPNWERRVECANFFFKIFG